MLGNRFPKFVIVSLPVLAVLSLILGFCAWLKAGLVWDDALFRAFGALRLSGQYADFYQAGSAAAIVPAEYLWLLRVSRILGIIAVYGTAVLTVFMLTRDALVRIWARGQKFKTIFIGDSQIITEAFNNAKTGGKFLRIGSDAQTGIWKKISLQFTDEIKKNLPKYLDHFDACLIAFNDDVETINFSKIAAANAPKSIITAVVNLESSGAIARVSELKNLRILTQGELAARALHRKNPPFKLLAQDQKSVHAAFVGFGETGFAIAKDVIINCRTFADAKPKVTIIDPKAESRRLSIENTCPEVYESAEIDWQTGGFGSTIVPPNIILKDLNCIYLCLGSDNETLDALYVLRSYLRFHSLNDVRLFVRLRDDTLIAPLENEEVFGSIEAIIIESNYDILDRDKYAKLHHEAHMAHLKSIGAFHEDWDSHAPWDSLKETFRNANRAALNHIGAKLWVAGIEVKEWQDGILPILADGAELSPEENKELMESLARLEHERWNAERRMDGWRKGGVYNEKGELIKSEPLKLHPSLVPFDELDEETKGYDYNLVTAVSKLIVP